MMHLIPVLVHNAFIFPSVFPAYISFLSLCLSVVYSVWEMRRFANGTSQINLKFRFFFLI